MNNKTDLSGKQIQLIGNVVEHLKLGSKEWVTIMLPDNQKITINIKYIKVC